jgi:hypothetical protein
MKYEIKCNLSDRISKSGNVFEFTYDSDDPRDTALSYANLLHEDWNSFVIGNPLIYRDGKPITPKELQRDIEFG